LQVGQVEADREEVQVRLGRVRGDQHVGYPSVGKQGVQVQDVSGDIGDVEIFEEIRAQAIGAGGHVPRDDVGRAKLREERVMTDE